MTKKDQYIKNVENSDLIPSDVKDTYKSEFERFLEDQELEIEYQKEQIKNNMNFDPNSFLGLYLT